MIQKHFLGRKLLMDFDFYVRGNKFIFQVFWLKCSRVLVFKVLVETDAGSTGAEDNARVASVGISKWRAARAQISKISHAGDMTVIEQFVQGGVGSIRSVRLDEPTHGSGKKDTEPSNQMGGFLMVPTQEKIPEVPTKMIVFQSLKINLEELVPSGSNVREIIDTLDSEKQKIKM